MSKILEGGVMQAVAEMEEFAALTAPAVYAVVTTGVYCRPGCGARRPLPENVRFFADAGAAAKAGYRACKRCRPDEALAGHEGVVAAACRRIEAAEGRPVLAALAAAAGMSAFHFHRIFRARTGVTPMAYYEGVRAARARGALAAGQSVTAAMYGAGYESSSGFYAAAPGVLGMPAAKFRAGGAGERISFGAAACAFGFVLVARTKIGICAISLGPDEAVLRAGFLARFSRAEIDEDVGLGADIAAVVSMIEAPGRGLALPLDVRGTVFQQRVWAALRKIPAGETASYARIARDIGAPLAVRAVAGACAANELAVAIPCHRAIRSDGGLAGYRWGVEVKRRLLEVERDG